MHKLDGKIREVFGDLSVYKSPDRYQIFGNRVLPSFIKDWLMKRFSDGLENINTQELTSFMNDHLFGSKNDVKRRLNIDNREVKLLCRFTIETDIGKGIQKFSVPDIGIKLSEGTIPKYVAKKYSDLIDGEHWGVITLGYNPPNGIVKGSIELLEYRTFQPYQVDIEFYRNYRKQFSTEEWIDVLIRAMEYNPHQEGRNGFCSFQRKHLFLTRLLVFLQPNLNLIELAPKGTGKSYVFSNISKYGWTFSGGKITRAKLFYDMARKTPGIITQKDFVAFDEIQTISFSDNAEMLGALKSYLELGKFTLANYEGTSSAGMILLGNIPLTRSGQPQTPQFFKHLPQVFQETALLDRFHGFIEGWNLIRMNKSMMLNGYTINVEYFSEILHKLREEDAFTVFTSQLLRFPEGSDTRDQKAITRLATAYLKLFFPHVKSVDDIPLDEFDRLCLQPAIEKRLIIKQQMSMIDAEYKPTVPEVGLWD